MRIKEINKVKRKKKVNVNFIIKMKLIKKIKKIIII